MLKSTQPVLKLYWGRAQAVLLFLLLVNVPIWIPECATMLIFVLEIEA